MATSPRPTPEAALSQALADHKAGRIEKALKGYRRILKRNPAHYDALVLAGQAAYAAGNRKDALRWLRRASEKYPDDPQGSYNLGVLQQTLGNTLEALDAFRLAAAAGPGFAPAQYNLAVTLFETGANDEALTYFDRTIEIDPNHGDAYAGKAFILRGQGKIDDAITAYKVAASLAPQNAKTWSALGISLQMADKMDEALQAHQNAISADRDYPDATSNLSDALIQMKKPAEAIAACDEYLARHPVDAGVLAVKSIALNEAGDKESYHSLIELDRLVQPIKLSAPSGFAGIGAFNKALGAHVLNHPTLITSPSSHATRKGKHTGHINEGEKGPVAEFEHLIDTAINSYMDGIQELGRHPICAHRPANYELVVWAVVLEGEGYQVPHIHPAAWLSGVYYVQVPDIANAGGHDGWIEFGQPGPEYHFSAEPALRLVKPEPGLVVMFPSYLFHRTVPFESEETRISIAFDVMPA